jgi:hypothetical protein
VEIILFEPDPFFGADLFDAAGAHTDDAVGRPASSVSA